MLTKVELELVNYFVRQTCKFGLAPLDWDEEELRAKSTTRKWKRCSSTIFTALVYAYLAFVFSRLPVTFERYKTSNKLDEAILHWIIINERFSVFVAVITSILHMEDIAYLLNLTTTLNKNYGQSNLRQEFLAPNLRQKCLQFLVASLYVFSGCFSMTFLANSENPSFVFTILPDSYKTRWTLALFLFFEMGFIFFQAVIFVTLLIVFFAYLTSVNFWLSYEWLVTKDSFEEITQAYRSIFLLSILHKNAYSGLYTPLIKFAGGVASMACTYAIIQLGDRISIISYLMCVTVIPICYIVLIGGAYFMSNVYQFSMEFTERLNVSISMYESKQSEGDDKKEKSLNKLILKSLVLIKCRVGTTYFMDKEAKCTLVDALIDGTVSLLLTN